MYILDAKKGLLHCEKRGLLPNVKVNRQFDFMKKIKTEKARIFDNLDGTADMEMLKELATVIVEAGKEYKITLNLLHGNGDENKMVLSCINQEETDNWLKHLRQMVMYHLVNADCTEEMGEDD